MHVQANQSLSFTRRWHDEYKEKVYPFLTAIIDVDHGVILGIQWDDACLFCNSTRCEENTYDFQGKQTTDIANTKACFIPLIECVVKVEDLNENSKDDKPPTVKPDNECELKIYFVWTGTDVDGRPLLSYESRFGAFPGNVIPQFSHITDFTNSMIQKFNDIKDSLNETFSS